MIWICKSDLAALMDRLRLGIDPPSLGAIGPLAAFQCVGKSLNAILMRSLCDPCAILVRSLCDPCAILGPGESSSWHPDRPAMPSQDRLPAINCCSAVKRGRAQSTAASINQPNQTPRQFRRRLDLTRRAQYGPRGFLRATGRNFLSLTYRIGSLQHG